jgi:azurin
MDTIVTKKLATFGALLVLAGLLGAAVGAASDPKTTPTKATTAGTPAAARTAAAPRTVTLSATDAMKFDPTTIQASAGEKLRMVLKPTSAMPRIAMAHNFVILKPGADSAAFANASAMARPDFIAPALTSQVVVATPIAGGGETASAEFTAPAKPGRYTFICTFPGHFAGGMKGVLIVK